MMESPKRQGTGERRLNQLLTISETNTEIVLQLDTGTRFKVSPQDKDFVLSYSWHLSERGRIKCNSKKYKNKHLSCLIAARMGLDLQFEIDHKDRDKLNNCRLNLREATRVQNLANSKVRKNSKLQLKGVEQKSIGCFTSRITVNGKRIYLGSYPTAAQAARAYNKAAREHFGEFALVNGPFTNEDLEETITTEDEKEADPETGLNDGTNTPTSETRLSPA